MLLSRAVAALHGRDFVVPEDVKAVAIPALAHRITLKPEMWLRQAQPSTVVTEVLANTPAPASGAMPSYANSRQDRQAADPYRYTAPPPRS
jgi:MoxR-like ATPase